MKIVDLGPVAYLDALARQRSEVESLARGEGEDLLILCEHEPVYTVGRGRQDGVGDPAAPRPAFPAAIGGVPVVEIERGGDITWHGPGQLVGYPIRRLPDRDPRAHIRRIERALVEALAALGVEARARPGFTGVWVADRKIASIGIAVRAWVAFHGFALNVSNDLSAFRAVRPCGLDPDVMTSLSEVLGRPVAPEEAKPAVTASILRAFGAA